MKPMLAQGIDANQLIDLAQDDHFCFQQKVDGERIMIVTEGRRVKVLNRRGEPSQNELSAEVRSSLAQLPEEPVVFDGELIGSKLWLFDLPRAGQQRHVAIDLNTTFELRYLALRTILSFWRPNNVELLPTAWTTEEKLRLTQRVFAEGGEGIIVRHRSAKYEAGKRTSTLLKAKFYKDVDCIATELGRNGKANIGLGLYANGELVDVGEVNALVGDGAKVQVGDVITVRYLYATNDNRIYQPNMPRIRTDKLPQECTLDQLQYTDKANIIKEFTND